MNDTQKPAPFQPNWELEQEILELIDNQDEFTRSDLQGVVTVLASKYVKRA